MVRTSILNSTCYGPCATFATAFDYLGAMSASGAGKQCHDIYDTHNDCDTIDPLNLLASYFSRADVQVSLNLLSAAAGKDNQQLPPQWTSPPATAPSWLLFYQAHPPWPRHTLSFLILSQPIKSPSTSTPARTTFSSTISAPSWVSRIWHGMEHKGSPRNLTDRFSAIMLHPSIPVTRRIQQKRVVLRWASGGQNAGWLIISFGAQGTVCLVRSHARCLLMCVMLLLQVECLLLFFFSVSLSLFSW